MGISWWESACVSELEQLHEIIQTHTARLPQINQIIRNEAAHQLSLSSERWTERQIDGEKIAWARKCKIIILIVKWQKNKRFPVCVFTQACGYVRLEGGWKAHVLFFLATNFIINRNRKAHFSVRDSRCHTNSSPFMFMHDKHLLHHGLLFSFLRSHQVLHPVIWRSVILGFPNHECLSHGPHRHGVQSVWDVRYPALQRPGRQEGLHLSGSCQRQGGAQVSCMRDENGGDLVRCWSSEQIGWILNYLQVARGYWSGSQE